MAEEIVQEGGILHIYIMHCFVLTLYSEEPKSVRLAFMANLKLERANLARGEKDVTLIFATFLGEILLKHDAKHCL